MRRATSIKASLVSAAVATLLLAPPLIAQQAEPPQSQLPQGKVSRLPPLSQPLDPIMQEMFDKRRAMGGAIINLQLVTGHAPKFSRAAAAMAFTIRFDATTPRRLLELVIMRTAEIVGSDYEINQHRPLMKLCGYSDAQIAEVATWRASSLFDPKQRVLLGFVEQMAHGGDVDDATFAALAAQFSSREIVEITYTVGSYYANGLLTKALKIERETDGRQTVAGTC
jgi:alkylhydroperoxidase family enzyme